MDASRRVIVTGANRGLGLALVRRIMKDQPHTKLIFTCREQAKGEEVLKALREEYPLATVEFHSLDVGDESSREAFATYIEKTGDSFDVLVNNAGLGETEDIWKQSQSVPDADTAARILETNVVATVQLTQRLLKYLSADGKVINVSSGFAALRFQGPKAQALLTDADNLSHERIIELAKGYVEGCRRGDIGDWKNRPYCASKAILNAWNRFVLRRELKDGQVAIAFTPGRCKTDMGGDDAPRSADDGADVYYRIIFEIPFGAEAKKYNGEFLSFKFEIADYVNCGLPETFVFQE